MQGVLLKFEEFKNRSNIVHNNKYNYKEPLNFSTKSLVEIVCKIKDHGTFTCDARQHLYQKQGCPFCSKKRKINYNIFIKESFDIHQDKYIYCLPNKLIKNNKISIYCKQCNHVFEQKIINHINRKNGCPCIKGNYFSQKSFIERALKINPEYNYSKVKFINARTKVDIICDKQHKFSQTPDNHIYKKQGCPICKTSSGERAIYNILKKNNILFSTQYKFKNCKNIRSLPFDFYLPDYNICIEYDGVQHFEEVEFFGGSLKFKELKKRDQIKNDFCNDNDVKLIRISHINSDIEIEKIIKEVL